MKIKLGRSSRNFVIFVAILVVMVQGAVALTAAIPPEPAYITDLSEIINVDGNPPPANPYGEWDLTNDFFAHMYKASNPNKELLSELYLRYDCTNGTLYALVLLEDGNFIDTNVNADNHFIKINETDKSKVVFKLVDGNTGDNDIAPDFQYILNGTDKIGWEASTDLPAGSYRLNVHTQVLDDQTSAVAGRDITLTIICGTNDIPEFPTIALPVAAILGLMFIFGRKRDL